MNRGNCPVLKFDFAPLIGTVHSPHCICQRVVRGTRGVDTNHDLVDLHLARCQGALPQHGAGLREICTPSHLLCDTITLQEEKIDPDAGQSKTITGVAKTITGVARALAHRVMFVGGVGLEAGALGDVGVSRS